MKISKKLWDILKIILFLAFGLLLLYLVIKSQKFTWTDFWNTFKKARYEYLLLVAALGIFSMYIRAIRWKLLIDSEQYHTRKSVLFYSIGVLYLTNFAIPRSGEVFRCATVSKYDKVPFSYVFLFRFRYLGGV